MLTGGCLLSSIFVRNAFAVKMQMLNAERLRSLFFSPAADEDLKMHGEGQYHTRRGESILYDMASHGGFHGFAFMGCCDREDEVRYRANKLVDKIRVFGRVSIGVPKIESVCASSSGRVLQPLWPTVCFTPAQFGAATSNGHCP